MRCLVWFSLWFSGTEELGHNGNAGNGGIGIGFANESEYIASQLADDGIISPVLLAWRKPAGYRNVIHITLLQVSLEKGETLRCQVPCHADLIDGEMLHILYF